MPSASSLAHNTPKQAYEPSLLELFFDLVFVFGVSQLSHPHGHASVSLSLLLGGGPILFLAAQGWYLRAVPNVKSQLHLVGGIGLLLVGLVTLVVPPYAALSMVGATLVILAMLDQRRGRSNSSVPQEQGNPTDFTNQENSYWKQYGDK
jgi:low temperature requirement protein LtrA